MTIRDAYGDDLAYIHDAGHGSLARDAAARLIDELAGTTRGEEPVIDLGCGSGLLSQALTQAGYRVLGIDVSDAMVALARARAPEAEFRVGSFVSSSLPTSVAVAAVGEVLNYTFDSMNDESARVDLFRRVYRALVPGGVFLFDIAGPDRAREGAPHRTFSAGTDWAALAETDLEPNTGLLTRTITSFRLVGSLYRRDTEVHRLALMDPSKVSDLLSALGFEVRTLESYRAVALPAGVVPFVARKPRSSAV